MAAIEAFIVKEILSWLADRLAAYIKAIETDRANHEKEVNQAEQDTKKLSGLNPDSTAKEVDDAIDDTLSHF